MLTPLVGLSKISLVVTAFSKVLCMVTCTISTAAAFTSPFELKPFFDFSRCFFVIGPNKLFDIPRRLLGIFSFIVVKIEIQIIHFAFSSRQNIV